MHERNTRFLLDTNLFIAAVKKGRTRTTELVMRLIDGPEDLVADKALIAEYGKYAEDLKDNGQLLIRYLLKIRNAGLIEVWTIFEAMARLL